jgi:hypothetical protein
VLLKSFKDYPQMEFLNGKLSYFDIEKEQAKAALEIVDS